MQEIDVDPKEMAPVGRESVDSPYFLYTRKQDGLWTSVNMGLFYIVLLFLALWGKEYVLLGLMVLLAIILIYDQVTNREFVEINHERISYYLPYMSYGQIQLNSIVDAELSPNQLRIHTEGGKDHILEIHALLSAKKKKELRAFVQEQISGLDLVER